MMDQLKTATFAGGCFWCMVKPFDQWDGIHGVVSGYTGGHTTNPAYEDVKNGSTGHYEAVQITYDPAVMPYEEILQIYWQQIDPTDDGGQFHDRGDSYRTAVFYHDDDQRELAEKSRQSIAENGNFKDPIVTKILPAAVFYPAEDYHQDYYKKNKEHYQTDRAESGRDEFIKNVWGKKV